MSVYRRIISEIAPQQFDPRHVEAFMRLEHSTLDHLSRADFEHEVIVCCDCIMQCGPEQAEACARSFGL